MFLLQNLLKEKEKGKEEDERRESFKKVFVSVMC